MKHSKFANGQSWVLVQQVLQVFQNSDLFVLSSSFDILYAYRDISATIDFPLLTFILEILFVFLGYPPMAQFAVKRENTNAVVLLFSQKTLLREIQ